MSEERVTNSNGCALQICSNHPAILERLAIMETTLNNYGDAIKRSITQSENAMKITTSEFRSIKNDITEGILKRHSSGVVAIISILTGLTCALAAVLFSFALRS
jgi:hypothetical protein